MDRSRYPLVELSIDLLLHPSAERSGGAELTRSPPKLRSAVFAPPYLVALGLVTPADELYELAVVLPTEVAPVAEEYDAPLDK